jgi:hypothetical protein
MPVSRSKSTVDGEAPRSKNQGFNLLIEETSEREPKPRESKSRRSQGSDDESSSSSDDGFDVIKKQPSHSVLQKRTFSEANEQIEERSDEEDSDGSEGRKQKRRSSKSLSSGSIQSLDSISSNASLDEDQLDRILIKQYANKMLTWETLSLSDKLSLFEKWYLVAFIGDLCIIFGTAFFYASNTYDLAISELIIGFGAFCIWISIVKYFKNTPLHYKILETMTVAAPQIFNVLVGFLPIMLGSTFLGMTLFYDYAESFGGFGKSFYTLIALQCGDMVYGFFEETTQCSLIFGTFFSYMYVFFAVS